MAPVAEPKESEGTLLFNIVPNHCYKSNPSVAAMEVDGGSAKPNSKSGKGEIKRRASKRRSGIVFPKYNERSKVKKSKGKK